MQGNGATTARKQEGIEALFCQSLGISKAPACLPYRYWHIDLHAGSGWNDRANCHGSPISFLRALARRRRSFVAMFCDHDPKAIQDLNERIGLIDLPSDPDSRIMIGCSDNSVWLREVAEAIRASERNPGKAFGTCLCDPNGYNDMPLDALTQFAAEFQRIDIILNVNLNLFRAVTGCKRPEARLSPALIESFRDWPDLPEIIDRLNRPYWHIRNPMRGGKGHNYTLLIGRSMKTKKRPFKDFYPLDSPEGQRILQSLKHEDIGQKYLFPGM